MLLYNNIGLISKVSEEIARENAENCRGRQSHCRLTTTPKRTSANIRINLQKLESLAYIFATDSIGLFSFIFFVVGSERRIFSGTECVSAVQGHPRSLILAEIERAYATPY